MRKERYYAIFKKEEAGGFAVRFPDAESTFTQGNTVDEALEMATEALSAILVTGRLGREYQRPRLFEEVKSEAEEGEMVLPVTPDEKIMEDYRPKKTY